MLSPWPCTGLVPAFPFTKQQSAVFFTRNEPRRSCKRAASVSRVEYRSAHRTHLQRSIRRLLDPILGETNILRNGFGAGAPPSVPYLRDYRSSSSQERLKNPVSLFRHWEHQPLD